MAGPYSAPCKVPASLLQEELMDFENAATHFHSDDSWSLSELDDEALQGIVSGKSTSAATAASTGTRFFPVHVQCLQENRKCVKISTFFGQRNKIFKNKLRQKKFILNSPLTFTDPCDNERERVTVS
ncbi:Hypothetical predicted protein [Cloeon dipterum]|uniref:Uncharacterized protein n=1 Tax=Cloeon dipterum TaxID=197152 RepID=A0A8S1E1B3_9INSE|nr:Hypothetical predicted protein [Cloeon dipterum]